MDLIVSLIIGGIVGWLASLIMKTDARMGIGANILVGIVGSALGFWLAGQLGLAAGGRFGAWLIAVAGAAVLIGLLKVTGLAR